ncbi:MAG: flagellar export protein FliJ [Fimbriimonadaceae bacterium]|nr:flagellar export protein FliJ [Fimbriimonadaceae bacterium]
MARFRFRLQRVLEFRATCEEAAKREFQQAQAAVLATERERDAWHDKKRRLLGSETRDIAERQTLEAAVLNLDDRVRHLQIAIEQLRQEAERAMERWRAAKIELEVMEKLRDKAFEAHRLEESRREQAEMDEFAVLRRMAA